MELITCDSEYVEDHITILEQMYKDDLIIQSIQYAKEIGTKSK